MRSDESRTHLRSSIARVRVGRLQSKGSKTRKVSERGRSVRTMVQEGGIHRMNALLSGRADIALSRGKDERYYRLRCIHERFGTGEQCRRLHGLPLLAYRQPRVTPSFDHLIDVRLSAQMHT
jgi:hypothetical protein